MSYRKSVLDQYADALAEPMLNIETFGADLTGTVSTLLRITKTRTDYAGDETWTVTSQLVDNIILQFPLSQVESFPGAANESYTANAINLWDVLPIKAFPKYRGTFKEVMRTFKRGDLLVKIIFDEFNNKIPIVLRLERFITSFLGQRKVRDHIELSLVRGMGSLEDDVQKVIDDYISTFGVPTVVSHVPATGYSGTVPAVRVQFNIAMEQSVNWSTIMLFSGLVGGYASGLLYSWETASGLVVSGLVNPDNYIAIITTGAVSTYQLPLEQQYVWNFIMA